MTIPAFEFRLKNAADRLEARKFVDLAAKSGRFHRNEKSQLTFEVTKGDHVLIVHKAGLRSILEDAGALQITGDVESDNCWDCLWFWLNERKWCLPRLNPSRPWNPPAPPGVAHLKPQDRYTRGKDVM